MKLCAAEEYLGCKLRWDWEGLWGIAEMELRWDCSGAGMNRELEFNGECNLWLGCIERSGM